MTWAAVTALMRSGHDSISSIVLPVESAVPMMRAGAWRLSRALMASFSIDFFAAATSSSVTPSRSRRAISSSIVDSAFSGPLPGGGTA